MNRMHRKKSGGGNGNPGATGQLFTDCEYKVSDAGMDKNVHQMPSPGGRAKDGVVDRQEARKERTKVIIATPETVIQKSPYAGVERARQVVDIPDEFVI